MKSPSILHRVPAAARLAACAWLLAAPAVQAIGLEAGDRELAARNTIAAELPRARLLWVRDDAIMHTRLDAWNPRRISPEGVRETRPRWSPDGTRIVFERAPHTVYVMNGDFTDPRPVIEGAHTADWTWDGRGITALSADGLRVLHYDLASGRTTTLYDATQPPYNGQPMAQAAELHPSGRYLLVFRRTPQHATEIVDLEQQRYIANAQMLRGDCKPAWTPDGRYLLTTARTANRPILFTPFDPDSGRVGDSQVLVNLSSWSRYYMHDARASNDSNWLVFAGQILVGDSMLGRREVYLWRAGDPPDASVRLTFDTDHDEKPSLFVPPAP